MTERDTTVHASRCLPADLSVAFGRRECRVDITPVTQALVDRALATVLFTDIVDSTQRAAALGDRRWHEVAVADIMKKDPITVSPTMTSLRAIEIMREKRVGCLPVVSEGLADAVPQPAGGTQSAVSGNASATATGDTPSPSAAAAAA